MKDKIYTTQSIIAAPVDFVFEWHERPGALERLTPPWDKMQVVQSSGGIHPGAKTILKMKAGLIPFRWQAEHTDYEQNRLFRDRQVRGPFAKWVHTHVFSADSADTCCYEDRIEYRLRFDPLGEFFMGEWVRRQLEQIFLVRHRTLADDLSLHFPDRHTPRMTLLISGASGVIGSALIPFLTTGGHRVIRLVRRQDQVGADSVYWNPHTGSISLAGLPPIDAVIHLAGENIGKGSWTAEKKQEIINSRTRGTAVLARAIAELEPKPKTFLSASAVGYYGNRDQCILTEADEPGADFISDVCRRWEQAADYAAKYGIRVVQMRIGVALTPKGGALAEMLPPFKLGLGATIGSGSQFISWISIEDTIGAIYHLLRQEKLQGPINITAPHPVTNLEFSQTLGKVLSRPVLLAAPASLIKLAYGEMGKEIPLSSTRVEPVKLLESGYKFRHPALEQALIHLLGRAII